MIDSAGFHTGTHENASSILDCGRLLKKAVQRDTSNSLYLSLGEWPRLPFTARIERAQFHRARSASKKGTWPLLHIFSAAC